MTQATSETANEITSTEYSGTPVVHKMLQRKPHGFAKLLGISGIVMAVALPVGVVPRVLQHQELDQAQAKVEEAIPQVSVIKAEPAPAQRTVNLPGAIEAIVETPIYARTNGYIKQRLVDIGDRVHAGQLLALIETPEIEESEREAKAQVLTNIAGKAQSEANRERAQADLDRAVAELSQSKANVIKLEADEKFAQSTHQRWAKLGIDGAVSAQDVEEKLTNWKTSLASLQAGKDRIHAAQSEVVAARARLQAERANVNVNAANILAAQARANRSTAERGFQNVASPFAGIITERNIDQGMLVSSGSDTSRVPLYRLARIDTVKAFVDVPQYEANGVRVGQQVNVYLKEIPGRTFTGKVARTSVALDSTARTLKTEIHIANPDLTLVPGMYADVTFSVARNSNVVLIPSNSLVMGEEGPRVATLTGSKIHLRSVALGDDLGKQVEIVGGLKKDEEVVVNPTDTLAEGTKVETNRNAR